MNDFAYTSNTTMQAIADRLRGASRVLVTSHEKPDGDAIGSSAAVCRALNAIGVANELWVQGPLSTGLAQFVTDVTLHHSPEATPADHFDCIAIVDTGARSQLQPLWPTIAANRAIAVGLDHHARGDDVCAERVVDVTAGSCTEMLIELVDVLGVPLDYCDDGTANDGRNTIAEALLLGIATDTGWFRFDNCTARTFERIARLIKAGADKSRMLRLIEETDRPARIAMTGLALNSAHFFCSNQAVIMSLTPEDFAATGARSEELSGIVNQPMSVEALEVAVLLTQTEAGKCKGSFRSKPGFDGAPGVDVNALAATFGGGGHVRAAGARFEGDLETVRPLVEAGVREALQAAGFSVSALEAS